MFAGIMSAILTVGLTFLFHRFLLNNCSDCPDGLLTLLMIPGQPIFIGIILGTLWFLGYLFISWFTGKNE